MRGTGSTSRRFAANAVFLAFFFVLPATPALSQTGAEVVLPDDNIPSTFDSQAPTVGAAEPAPAAVADELPPPPELPTVGGAWVAEGPGPSRYGQTENVSPDNEVTGAIHTAAAHPTNADILYIGSVNGGIWKTVDATTASPTWTHLTDNGFSMSIGALEFDFNDAAHNTLVAGIGRASSYYSYGGPRAGLLRTTDGGSIWSELDGGGTLTGKNISGVAVRGNTIVVSVNYAESFTYSNIGIFRSTDTGATFTRSTGSGGTGFSGRAFDLVGHRNIPTVLYTAIKDSSDAPGVYKSIDTGASWSRVSDATMNASIGSATSNIEMAIHDDGLGGNAVYVAILNSGQLSRGGVFRSADGGASWAQMDLPLIPAGSPVILTNATNTSPIVVTSTGHGLSTGNHINITGVTGNTAANGNFFVTAIDSNTFSLNGSTGNGAYVSGGEWTYVDGVNPSYKPDAGLPGGQGYIHFSIVADPVDPFTVYLAGDRQDLPFPNYIGATNYSGNLWRGDASVARGYGAPSPQWEHLTHSDAIETIPGGGTAGSSSPHADSREMVFDANGEIIETDDGGVYRRTNPADNTGDWYSICGNLQVTEQHDVAYCPTANVILSGNQDTGTTQQSSAGSTTWNSVATADGGDVAIDATSMPGSSIRYSSYQYLQSFRRFTYNSSNAQTGWSYPSLTGKGGWSGSFVSTIELNGVDPTRLVIGGSNGILESTDRGNTCTYLVTSAINKDCLTYGSNGNTQVLYAGSASGVLARLAGTGAPTATSTPFPGGTVMDLIVHPLDQDRCFVIDSDRVFETTDAGSTWTDRTGDLVNTDLRAIEFLPGSDPAIAVGGWANVYRMSLSNPGVWSELGSSLPNVPVYDLDYDATTDEILVAGTLGRGAWSLLNDVTPPAPDPMTWDNPPTAISTSSITMTGTIATDPRGVEYYFECAAGGGNDSGWQDSPVYADTGLLEFTACTYRVRARDKSANQNATAWSFTASASTTGAAPTMPGSTGIAADSITWTWTDNSTNESGFNVYCAGGATPPSTSSDTTVANATQWTTTSLQPNTLYAFQVAATGAGVDSSKTAAITAWTLAATPQAPVVSNATASSLDVTIGAGDGNPAYTEYAIYCVTTGLWAQADGSLSASAAWQETATWGTKTVTGLDGAAGYAFRTRARNEASVETADGPSAAGNTDCTLTYLAGAYGSISGETTQFVNHGADGTAVTAVPDIGYHFVDWSDTSTDNPRTDANVTTDVAVTANFSINRYSLTYTAGANGFVSGDSPQTVDHGAAGTAVTAIPNAGYHFDQWSDSSTDNPRTDTNVTTNVSVTANFAATDGPPAFNAGEIAAAGGRALQLVATSQQPTGLVDSYSGDGLPLAHTFDQALALLALSHAGLTSSAMAAQADALARELIDLQVTVDSLSGVGDAGFWYIGYDTGTEIASEWKKHTGPCAWVGYALLYYAATLERDNADDAREAAARFARYAIDYLRDDERPDRYDYWWGDDWSAYAGGAFYSTEINLDMWWLLHSLGTGYSHDNFGDGRARTMDWWAARVYDELTSPGAYWDGALGRWKEGLGRDFHAEDAQTWGAVTALYAGDTARTTPSLAFVLDPARGLLHSEYNYQTEYYGLRDLVGMEDNADSAAPQACNTTIWNEGSAHTVCALYYADMPSSAAMILDSLLAAEDAVGGLTGWPHSIEFTTDTCGNHYGPDTHGLHVGASSWVYFTAECVDADGDRLPFADIQLHALTTEALHGTVLRSPDRPAYAHGTTVTITAIADQDYRFMQWSGGVTTNANPLVLAITAATTLTAHFVPTTGTLQVTIDPQEAAVAGAQWSVDAGATWLDSGSILTLDTGDYTVEFSAIADWDAPAAQAATVSADALTTATGHFTRHTGALTVTLGPQGAVDAGARWRRVETSSWLTGGATETEIPTGDTAVEFLAIANWVAPVAAPVTVGHDTTATLQAGYLHAPITSSLVWVDFAYGGEEFGSEAQPYRSLAHGCLAVDTGGTVRIKSGTSAETPRLTKAMRLEAAGGTVRIGDPSAQEPLLQDGPSALPAVGRAAQQRSTASHWTLYR
jgi:hypothetical protein